MQPCACTPAASARACVCRPGKAGSREGWMLRRRSCQRSTKLGGEDAHEAGEADELDRGSSTAPPSSARLEGGAVREPCGDRVAVGMPASRARVRPKASARLLTTRTIAALAPGRAVASISAWRLEPPPEIRTATRRRAMRASSPANSTRGRPGAAAMVPIVCTVSPAAASAARHASARPGSTTRIMPMPQLKVRSSSMASSLPACAEPGEHGRQGPACGRRGAAPGRRPARAAGSRPGRRR